MVGVLAVNLVGCGAPDRPLPPRVPPDGTDRGPLAAGDALVRADASISLVADDGALYWVEGGHAIRRRSASGGAPRTVYELASETITSVAASGGRLYLTTQAGALQSVPVAGGRPTTLATEEGVASARVSGGEVFFMISRRVRHGPGEGRICKVGIAVAGAIGIEGGRVTTLVDGVHLEGGFAVAAGGVYYTTPEGVMRVPTSGGAPSPVRGAPLSADVTAARPGLLAVDEASVFWIDTLFDGHGIMDRSAVEVAPLAGGPAVLLAELPGGPSTLLGVHGGYVYATTTKVGSGGAENALFAIPKRGGAPIRIDGPRPRPGL